MFEVPYIYYRICGDENKIIPLEETPSYFKDVRNRSKRILRCVITEKDGRVTIKKIESPENRGKRK
jgi:hypothetical protein